MPELHSKMAVVLAEKIIGAQIAQAHWQEVEKVAAIIDERLAKIRKHYEPEEFERCPVVKHHRSNAETCQFCVTAAMREFILIPTE